MSALALLALFLADAGAVDRPTVFLSHIAVDKRSQRPWGDGAGFRVVLEGVTGKATNNELVRRKAGRAVDEQHLTVEGVGYPASKDAPTSAHRRASFVIDFDQPAVRALRAEAKIELGAEPTVAQLTAFVRRSLRQTMVRPFDIASAVAQRREGDCTEHAVLLAALARASGRPARVVYGLALLPVGQQVLAEGHAWVEYFERGRWHPADAALAGLEVPLVYLPIDLMRDEGPGFALATVSTSVLAIRKVILEAR